MKFVSQQHQTRTQHTAACPTYSSLPSLPNPHQNDDTRVPLILCRSPRFLRPCPSSPPLPNAQTIRVLQFPHRSEQESAPRSANTPVHGSQIILPREPLAGARVLSVDQRAASEVRASKADDMCAAFSFFSSLIVKQLRGILKNGGGNNPETRVPSLLELFYIYKVFLYLDERFVLLCRRPQKRPDSSLGFSSV